MASSSTHVIKVTAGTDLLVRKLEAIARHAKELAAELIEIDTEAAAVQETAKEAGR